MMDFSVLNLLLALYLEDKEYFLEMQKLKINNTD